MKRGARRRLGVALGLTAVSLASCFDFPFSGTSSDPTLTEIGRLAAVLEVRPFEPRISGGLAFAPCETPVENGVPRPGARCASLPAPGSDRFRRLAALSSELRSSGNDGLHAQALWHLLWSVPSNSVDTAIQVMEQIVADQPERAPVWSDLAAAYYIRYRQSDRPYDLLRALSAIESAVAQDTPASPSPETLFNRGLILDALHLKRQAKKAWTTYLAHAEADEPGWRAEASEKERRAGAPPKSELWRIAWQGLVERDRFSESELERLVALSPKLTRESTMTEILEKWATATLAGATGQAGHFLELAESVGEKLRDAGGDRSLCDFVALVRGRETDRDSLEQLARAQLDFSAGQRRFEALEIDEAEPLLLSAKQQWGGIGNPMSLWAQLSLAGIAFYRGGYATAAAGFGGLSELARTSGYWSLEGRSEWGLGMVRARELRPTAALRHYQTALTAFEKTGETEHIGALHALLGEQVSFLGQLERAWHHRLVAFEQLVEFPDSRRLENLLSQSASDSELADLHPLAALVLQDEAISITSLASNHQLLANELLRRSKTLTRLGRGNDASRDILATREQLSLVASPTMRSRSEADLSVAEGRLHESDQPERSLQAFTRAIGLYRQQGFAIGLVEASLGRAQALAALERWPEAEEDLFAALRLFDEQDRNLVDPQLHESLKLSAIALFDRLILVAANQNDAAGALWYAERSRHLGYIPEPAAAPVPSIDGPPKRHTAAGELVTALQKHLSRRHRGAILALALIDDELFSWVLTSTDFRFFRRPIGEAALREDARSFVRETASGPSLTSRAGETLYELLLPDEVRDLPEDADLYLIPDKFLNGLPFAALTNPRTGKYLVEERAVGILPAAELLLRSPAGTGSKETRPLLIADPAFDETDFPWLPRLPSALVEIASIAQLYPEVTTLIGDKATKTAILSALPSSSLLHFAGHAVFRPDNADQSFLVLARNADGSGTLDAGELRNFARRLPALVVLSACETVSATRTRTGTVTGLARPFLEGGSRNVVGTLWNVQDAVSATFFKVFYEKLRESGSPIRALRQAQLNMGHSQSYRAPFFWAGYQVVGGMD